MLYHSCTMISSVDLALYGVFRAKIGYLWIMVLNKFTVPYARTANTEQCAYLPNLLGSKKIIVQTALMDTHGCTGGFDSALLGKFPMLLLPGKVSFFATRSSAKCSVWIGTAYARKL